MNVRYARACLLDALSRGESPIASHLLYTRVLDEADPLQRAQGIEAGLAWRRVADASVLYTDRGISPGMAAGAALAERAGIPVEHRSIEKAPAG